MTEVVLVEAWPFDPVTGQAVPVRLAGGGREAYSHLGYRDWRAGVATLPRFTTSLGFGDGGWNGSAIPQVTPIRVTPSDPVVAEAIGNAYWPDAMIRLTIFDDRVSPPVYVTRFVGRAATAPVEGSTMTITVGDLSVDLNRPAAPDYFTGAGGIEGPIDITDRLKRRALGAVFNVEGRILDKANNIYEFADPARPLQGFAALRDKGREGPRVVLAWQGSIAATFAALQAAAVPSGGGVVAPSIACAKWFTVASGPLTADLLGEVGAGYVDTAAALVERLAAERGIPAQDVARYASLRPATVGVYIDTAGETTAQAMDRLLQGVGLLWKMTAVGQVQFGAWQIVDGWDGPQDWTPGTVAGVAWQGSDSAQAAWVPLQALPLLTSLRARRLQTLAPLKDRRLGYRKNHRKHSDAEISAAIQATDVIYESGVPVAAKEPAEAAAQITRSISADTTSLSFIADAGGVVSADQLPATVRFQVIAGAVNVSARAEWIVQTTGGVTATIDNAAGSMTRGVVTVTAVSAPGDLIATAMVDNAVVEATVAVQTRGALADKTTADRESIAPGAITGTRSFTSPDVAVGSSETTLIETPQFMIGDDSFGQALIIPSFSQDASTEKDVGWRIRVYVDEGAGYVALRDQPQGLRTAGSGDTYWTLQGQFPVTVEATAMVRVKVTAQAIAFAGGGVKTGTTARYIRVDVFQGAR